MVSISRKSTDPPSTRPAIAAPKSRLFGRGADIERLLRGGRGFVRHADFRHRVVLLDVPDELHTIGDLAEYRMDTVQVAGVAFVQDDEELTSSGVLPGVGHRERTHFVLS